MNKYILLSLLFLTTNLLNSQDIIQRVEPPNWWTGMKHPKLQLLIYGKNISEYTPSIKYAGIRLERTIKVESPNYLFLDLHLEEDVKHGTVKIDFSKNGTMATSYNWKLEKREPGSADRRGFNSTDVLYLITPDRFANGNEQNDSIPGLKEGKNRSFKGGRHGGDIEGIRKNLDYIADMGFTAIWLNPLLENDMKEYSYHGYSTTDFYKVDSRFGSNESYRQMAKEAKTKGITLIMDMIVNHCGLDHWWMNDLPSADWINHSTKYVETNHRKTVLQDPHVSEIDRRTFADGWFVPSMT